MLKITEYELEGFKVDLIRWLLVGRLFIRRVNTRNVQRDFPAFCGHSPRSDFRVESGLAGSP